MVTQTKDNVPKCAPLCVSPIHVSISNFCIWKYLYLYLYLYLHLHIHIDLSLYIYIHIHACIHTCTHTYIRTYIHTECIYIYIHLCAYAYLCIDTHIYIWYPHRVIYQFWCKSCVFCPPHLSTSLKDCSVNVYVFTLDPSMCTCLGQWEQSWCIPRFEVQSTHWAYWVQ